MASADLNEDTYGDLVVGGTNQSTLRVFLGDGTGALHELTSLSGSSNFTDIVLSDMDSDGYPDIVCAESANRVTVFFGDAGLTFAQAVSMSTSGFPVSVTVSDLNGDGVPDLVTAISNDCANLFTQVAARSFSPRVRLDSIRVPSVVRCGRSADGESIDIFILSSIANAFAVHTPAAPGDYPMPRQSSTGDFPFEVQAADLDGNGQQDVLISCRNDQALIAQMRGGDGTFGSPVLTALAEEASVLVTANFNGDGLLDVVALRDVYLGTGAGTFSFLFRLPEPVGRISSIASGDLDQDGVDEIIMSVVSPFETLIYSYSAPGSFLLSAKYSEPKWMARPLVRDLNGDGYPDVLLPSQAAGGVAIRLNDGAGNLLPGVEYPAVAPIRVVVADFNQDGNEDFAVVGQAYEYNYISVFSGDGTGGFVLDATYPAGSLPVDLIAADVNGDGLFDLATANFGENTLSLYLGLGNGAFAWQGNIGAGSRAAALAVSGASGGTCAVILVPNDVTDTITEIVLPQATTASVEPPEKVERPSLLQASVASNRGGVTLWFSESIDARLDLDLFDISGRLVARLGEYDVSSSERRIEIKPRCGDCLSRLSRGIFFLRVKHGDTSSAVALLLK